MDKPFVDLCRRIIPPMNPRVMEGHLTYEIKDQERRIEETLRKAFDGRFKGRMRCGGLMRCSPQEQCLYAVKPKNTERSFELAPSDVYLTKSEIYFDDELLITVYFYLLAVDYGAVARLSRTLYSFRPTIADKVFSPENKHIFVRLDQYRMNLMQLSHPVSVNGRQDMEAEVTWGQIHKSSREKKAGIRVKAKSCLVHYLLGHYGFSKMFEKYFGFVPVYGSEDDLDKTKYPEKDWVVVKTAHKHVKAISCIETPYVPTKLFVAVPREKWSWSVRAVVMSVFYVVDSFPSILTLDKMEHLNSWRLTLGQILFSPELTVQRILSQVEEHFNSSDTYMDTESIHKLRQNGYVVNDFHDLLFLLASRFTSILQGGDNGSLYGKYLDTLRDIIDPVIKSINNTKYDLLELELKSGNVTPNKIRDVIGRSSRPGAIFDNNRNNQLVEAVAYSGDHPYFKMTSRLGVASRAPVGKPGGRSKGPTNLGPEHYITTSRALVGSVLNLAKHNPVLTSHINPFILTDPDTGTVLEDPTMKKEMEEVDAKLNDKMGKN